jgi:hypothetical protein
MLSSLLALGGGGPSLLLDYDPAQLVKRMSETAETLAYGCGLVEKQTDWRRAGGRAGGRVGRQRSE